MNKIEARARILPVPVRPIGQPFIPGERQALAIRRVKAVAAVTATAAQQTQSLLDEMVVRLYEIRETDSDPEIQKLIDRAFELKRLENIQELQSWKITVDRVMDEAWRRLP